MGVKKGGVEGNDKLTLTQSGAPFNDRIQEGRTSGHT